MMALRSLSPMRGEVIVTLVAVASRKSSSTGLGKRACTWRLSLPLSLRLDLRH